MISKFIKSSFIIFSEVFSSYGFKGLKRLILFLSFGIKLSFYIYLEQKEIKISSFSHFLLTKLDPLLLLSKEKRHEERARWLLDQILLRGTTFIKLGQILATRADLIPLPYMEQLAKLQDEVPPFDNNIAFEMIKSELGKPVTGIFYEFEPMPIASASLGQVYKAKIIDTKNEVIIKVQRPNLKEQIEEDVFILKVIAKQAINYPAISRGNDFEGLLDEFLRVLNEEIDYIKEGKHCDLFRKNFKGNYQVYVPRVYWQYTTRKVITLEHIGGFKVTEVEKIRDAGLNLKEITKEGCNVYLKQLLTDGFFHADPHPGNLRVLADGRLAFFDFGMVGTVSKETQIALVNTILHLINRNYKEVVNCFLEIGLLRKDFKDTDKLAMALEPIYDARFGHTKDITTTFRQILKDLAHIFYEYPFRIPVELALIIRALLTLEGLGHTLDPGFNVIKALIPFVQKYMFTREGLWLREYIEKQGFSRQTLLINAINLFKVPVFK